MRQFLSNRRAVTTAEIVGVALSFFLLAILGPIALSEIANATTTNWEASVITIFQVVLPIIWVVGMAIKYLPRGQ